MTTLLGSDHSLRNLYSLIDMDDAIWTGLV